MNERRPGLGEGPLDERLVLGWQALSPPLEALPRVRARVLAGEGAGALGGAGGAARAGSGWRALKASGGAGLAAGTALLALGFAAGYLLHPDALEGREVRPPLVPASDAPPELTAPITADPGLSARNARGSTAQAAGGVGDGSADAIVAAPIELTRGDGAPSALPPTPPTPPRARRATPPRARLSEAEELLALGRAERAVRARHPELALALLRELADAHPVSSFLEERSALELMASCQLDAHESSARAAAFARRYPASVYAERVAAECTSPTNASAPDMNGDGGFHVKP